MITYRNVTFNESKIPCFNEITSSDVPEGQEEERTRMQIKLMPSPKPINENQSENEIYEELGDDNVQESTGELVKP